MQSVVAFSTCTPLTSVPSANSTRLDGVAPLYGRVLVYRAFGRHLVDAAEHEDRLAGLARCARHHVGAAVGDHGAVGEDGARVQYDLVDPGHVRRRAVAGNPDVVYPRRAELLAEVRGNAVASALRVGVHAEDTTVRAAPCRRLGSETSPPWGDGW